MTALMYSWRMLPEATLDARGPDSEALLQRGCTRFRDAARLVHELPYGRNSDRTDYRLVLTEQRGTCSTKHALLAAVAREQQLSITLTLGIYDANEDNTPGLGRVLAARGLSSIPEAHCYLSHAGRRIDVTRADVVPQAAISCLYHECSIEPVQIGAHKIRLHRAYLEQWLRRHPEILYSPEELWQIREECILALASG